MKILASLYLVIFFLSLAIQPLAQAAELTQWESLVPGEEDEAKNMAQELIGQVKKDYVDQNKRAFRDAHPRGIACVAAQFTIAPNLPAQYQGGVFAQPGKTYDALIRFSSSLGPASDHSKDARGMAIKLLGVSGGKLLPSEADALTQDFLMINTPAFPAKNAHDFAGLVRLKSDPKSITGFLREAPITRARELKALLDSTQGNPFNGKSLLATQFFSQVPYLFKSTSVNSPIKFTARPCTTLGARQLDGSEGELRNDLQAFLKEQDACFEFALQFYKEGAGFEVENGMSVWQESKSPFIKFASVTIPRQTFLTDEKLHYCDNLSYQPWHALDAHRPLGNINRTRKIVYEMLSKYRHDANQENAAYSEPKDLSTWKTLNSSKFSVWDAIKVAPTSR